MSIWESLAEFRTLVEQAGLDPDRSVWWCDEHDGPDIRRRIVMTRAAYEVCLAHFAGEPEITGAPGVPGRLYAVRVVDV